MRVYAQALLGCGLLSLLGAGGVAMAADGPLLADAARSRDSQAVQSLLKRHADVNLPQADGATALHWAVHWDDLETADLLIRAGANVSAANAFAATPLSLACAGGRAAMVDRLLTAGADANTTLAGGETVLMTCARVGSVEAVTSLLRQGANPNATERSLKQTALMWAAAAGYPAVVRTLLEKGADARARSETGFTPLHFAARQGDVETARLLVTAGADANGLAADGSTPLLVAAVRGNVPLALFLLDRGADPNAGKAGFAALHWAVGTWETRLTGAIGFRDPMAGIADRAAKLELVKALLAHGANPNVRTEKDPPRFGSTGLDPKVLVGATPFSLAAFAADVELMRLLVAAGADPKLATANHTTPLMLAAGTKRPQGESFVTEDAAIEAVTLALELGGDVNALNDEGENCVHGVAYLGWNRLLRLVVADHGANLNVVSKRRLTPLVIAQGYGDRDISLTVVRHQDTAELLLGLGADPGLGARCEAKGCGATVE